MALLQVVRGLNPGQQFPIEGEQAIVGRHPDCDIVLDVGAVSRQHAQILQVGGDYYIEDLKSRNGTFVNGRQIEGRERLNENDSVKICDVLLTFHHQDPKLSPLATISASATATLSAEQMPEYFNLPLPGGEGSSLVIEEGGVGSGTIMSTFDVQTSRTGLTLNVNAEVKLKALLEITRDLGSTIDLVQVLPKMLDSLFKIFAQADRGFVLLKDPQRDTLVPKAVKHRRGDQEDTMRISRTILNQVMSSREAILSADAASDSRFDTSQSIADFRIRSMMCAPLVGSEGEALGVIQIDTLDQRARFTQDDLEVLASVAVQAAISVENAQLHESTLLQKSVERDLQLAHKVQHGFLPATPPDISGYEFFDFYESANQVGGDYFDYVPLPGNRMAVVVADVSGKGISAALLMAKLSSEVRYSLVSETEPARALRRINGSFSRASWEDRFVTLALAVIDFETNQLTVANAGHMPPLKRHVGQVPEEIGAEAAGVPLGVDPDYEYEQVSLPLVAGDSLVMFTDGFSEAMNSENELYGLARLQQVLQQEPSCSVRTLGARILDDVKRFAGTRPQSDDMCMICFGRSS